MTLTPSNTSASSDHPNRRHAQILDVAHTVILILSLMLIVFISYDTLRDIPFMQSRSYMTFQLIVCFIFIADFFLELALTTKGRRRQYMASRWLFLLLSIPYLNIISYNDIQLSPDALYFIRFIPLARGALALTIVLDYISSTPITGIFVSYMAIVVLTTYFGALIFYYREHPVNPEVPSFLNALIWCALQTTTLGSSVSPMTIAGKAISVVLSFMGIMMYPLFTVYVSSLLAKKMRVLNFTGTKLSNVKDSSLSDNPHTSTDDTLAQNAKKL